MASFRIVTPGAASSAVAGGDCSLEMEALAGLDVELVEAPIRSSTRRR